MDYRVGVCMKLKKQIKVFFVLILLGGIVGGIYSFNNWFFTKYKSENQNTEEKEEKRKGKEILSDFENKVVEENKEVVKEEKKENQNASTSSDVNSSVFAVEEKYCKEPYVLKNEECVAEFETEPLTKIVSDGDDIYIFEISFVFENMEEGFQIQEECIKEGGRFEFKYNTEEVEGICFLPIDLDSKEETSCLEGYTLKKGTCIKEVSQEPLIRYQCPSGYKLDGILCFKK